MHHLRNYGIPVAVVLYSVIQMNYCLPIEKKEKHLVRRRRDGDPQTRIAPVEWFELLTPEGSESSADDTRDNETMTINGTSQLGSLLDMQTMTHDSTHCQNGGVGFLGSFCFCLDGFTGQYCEKEIKGSCNLIPHAGDWTYLDCSLCQCVSGFLECTSHHLEGCEEREEERRRKLDAENNGQLRQGPQLMVFYSALLLAIAWINVPYRYVTWTLYHSLVDDIR